MVHSFVQTKQKGRLTRLMACDKPNPPGMEIASPAVHPTVDTHVHPNWAVHPKTHDAYVAALPPPTVRRSDARPLPWAGELHNPLALGRP
jgi:hypothetical protein